MLSSCDEDISEPGPTQVDGRSLDWLNAKMEFFLPQYHPVKNVVRVWSGLRTFSKDGRFIAGWDASVPNLFWVACLGGYGLTASAAMGRLASSLLTHKPVNPQLQSALSPARFTTAHVPQK